MAADFDDDEVTRQVVGKLQEKYPDRPAEEVETVVREELAALTGRPVRDYLMVLTERNAKKRLKSG